MSKHKKKKTRRPGGAAPRPAPAPEPQLPPDFPPFLHYRVSPRTQQADAAIAAVTQRVQHTLQTKSVIQGKAALEEIVLPLFGHLMQLVVSQSADIVQWAQAAMYEMHRNAEPAEPLIGIPAEEADDLCARLEEVMEWLEKTPSEVDVEAYASFAARFEAEAATHRETLADVAEAIDDYALEETPDEDEGDEDDEDEGDEDEPEAEPAADEPPLHIVDPDAAPLVR